MPAKQFPRAWDRGSRSCSDAELERSQHRCARSFPPVAFHRASCHRDAAWAPTHMGGPFLPSLGQHHTVPRMPESWRVEKIDIAPSEDVCPFAMVSEGILRAQCFVSCVTIRSRPITPARMIRVLTICRAMFPSNSTAAAFTPSTLLVHLRLARHVGVPSWIGNRYRTATSA